MFTNTNFFLANVQYQMRQVCKYIEVGVGGVTRGQESSVQLKLHIEPLYQVVVAVRRRFVQFITARHHSYLKVEIELTKVSKFFSTNPLKK